MKTPNLPETPVDTQAHAEGAVFDPAPFRPTRRGLTGAMVAAAFAVVFAGLSRRRGGAANRSTGPRWQRRLERPAESAPYVWP